MRKKTILSTILVSAIVLTSCGSTTSTNSTSSSDSGNLDSSASYTLMVGTALTEADPIYKGLEQFETNVEQRTNGDIDVQLYSGSQLGSDEDVLEQAIVGAGVGIITDPGRLANYISDFGIFGGPYLVDNYDEALKLLDTSVYHNFESQFEDYGLKILSFNYFQGSRNLFTKKPIRSPEDLKGQVIRSSGSEIVTDSLEAMGANTTVLPWSESYQGLQQGALDGVEVHNSAAVGSSIDEVTNYVSETGHFQLLTGLVISNSWYEKLPEDYKTILSEESYNAGTYASDLVIENEEKYLDELIDGGVEVVDDVDIDAFKDATESVYDDLGFREMKDQIDEELGK